MENANWQEMTPEQLAETLKQMDAEDIGVSSEYAREQIAGFRECAHTADEVYQLLEQYDIPNSVQNILAMEEMMADRNGIFHKLFAL